MVRLLQRPGTRAMGPLERQYGDSQVHCVMSALCFKMNSIYLETEYALFKGIDVKRRLKNTKSDRLAKIM